MLNFPAAGLLVAAVDNAKEQAAGADELQNALTRAPEDLTRRVIDLPVVLTDFTIKAINWLPNLVTGLFILLIFWVTGRWVRALIGKSLKLHDFEDEVIAICRIIIMAGFMMLGLIVAAGQMGIEILPMVSALGVVGIAVGLAAQATLSNFLSSLIILWTRPYKRGDWVELEGELGQVEHIGLRSTQIRTKRNYLVDLPSSLVTSHKVINRTFFERIQVRATVGIAYKEQIAKARETLLALTKESHLILQDPPPQVIVKQIAPSSLEMELRVWTSHPALEDDILWFLNQRIKEKLDEAKIEIPYPHQQVIFDTGSRLTVENK